MNTIIITGSFVKSSRPLYQNLVQISYAATNSQTEECTQALVELVTTGTIAQQFSQVILISHIRRVSMPVFDRATQIS